MSYKYYVVIYARNYVAKPFFPHAAHVLVNFIHSVLFVFLTLSRPLRPWYTSLAEVSQSSIYKLWELRILLWAADVSEGGAGVSYCRHLHSVKVAPGPFISQIPIRLLVKLIS
jgi:hypothetical protein